jgi:spermidine synthase
LNRYSIDSITLVEIDEAVVKCSREFFPALARGLADPKVELVVGEGSHYVRHARDHVDIVIVDAPDPIGEGKKLFEMRFYRDCFRMLLPGGVLAVQSESPYLFPKISARVLNNFQKIFRKVRQTSVIVPSYPGGSIGFTFGVKD